jgi:hypothetical protein
VPHTYLNVARAGDQLAVGRPSLKWRHRHLPGSGRGEKLTQSLRTSSQLLLLRRKPTAGIRTWNSLGGPVKHGEKGAPKNDIETIISFQAPVSSQSTALVRCNSLTPKRNRNRPQRQQAAFA